MAGHEQREADHAYLNRIEPQKVKTPVVARQRRIEPVLRGGPMIGAVTTSAPEPQDRSGLIRELCEQWVASLDDPGGGTSYGERTHQFLLIRNGIKFHELSHAELRVACLGLSHRLALPDRSGVGTIVTADHLWFWAWCAEVFLGPLGGYLTPWTVYFQEDEQGFHDLFELCVHTALPKEISFRGRDAWHLHDSLMDLLLRPSGRYVLTRSFLGLAYLAFPLLEAVVKKACKQYIAPDGSIRQRYTIVDSKGKTQTRDGRFRVSQLTEVIMLLYQHVASSDLRADMDEQQEHLRSFTQAPSESPYDVLYRWRNEHMHGAADVQALGGIVLNTAILFMLAGIAGDYEQRRSAIAREIDNEFNLASIRGGARDRGRWEYYPL